MENIPTGWALRYFFYFVKIICKFRKQNIAGNLSHWRVSGYTQGSVHVNMFFKNIDVLEVSSNLEKKAAKCYLCNKALGA